MRAHRFAQQEIGIPIRLWGVLLVALVAAGCRTAPRQTAQPGQYSSTTLFNESRFVACDLYYLNGDRVRGGDPINDPRQAAAKGEYRVKCRINVDVSKWP